MRRVRPHFVEQRADRADDLDVAAFGVAGIFGQDVDIGKGISDLLVTDLVKDGTYSVIERKADLKMSDDGTLSGKVTMTFSGLEALRRRIEERGT